MDMEMRTKISWRRRLRDMRRGVRSYIKPLMDNYRRDSNSIDASVHEMTKELVSRRYSTGDVTIATKSVTRSTSARTHSTVLIATNKGTCAGIALTEPFPSIPSHSKS